MKEEKYLKDFQVFLEVFKNEEAYRGYLLGMRMKEFMDFDSHETVYGLAYRNYT